MGQTRFPVYDLVSTWYHEGVPGHHLQLAQWAHVSQDLSRYQATVGGVSANAEGWALYAERLMDELGFPPTRAAARLLDAQMMRAVRVIIDIGMHLELEIPADSPFHPGERWTAGLAQEFFGSHSSRPADFVESELVRYLSMPGQAIGYKLGERAWLLAGRTPGSATATRSTRRPGTWRRSRRVRWAWTIWWTNCRGSEPDGRPVPGRRLRVRPSPAESALRVDDLPGDPGGLVRGEPGDEAGGVVRHAPVSGREPGGDGLVRITGQIVRVHGPGLTVLTVTPRSASAVASERVMEARAPFCRA